MAIHRAFSFVFLLAMLLGFMILPACESPSEYKPAISQMPLSNQRILNQAVMGSTSAGSSLYGLIDDGMGALYFMGLLDGEYVIGRIQRNGQTLWVKNTGRSARHICRVPQNPVGLANTLLTLRDSDSDDDGKVDKALVLLMDSNGEEIDTLTVEEAGQRVWLNAIVPVDSLNFLAVGGSTALDNVYHPFVATITIEPDGTIIGRSQRLYGGFPNQLFGYVIVDPSTVTPTGYTGYIRSNVYDQNNDVHNIVVHAFHVSKITGPDAAPLWSVDLKQQSNLPLSRGNLILSGTTLYTAGLAQVMKDSKKWNAGYVASISTGGTLNRFTVVSITNQGDDFSDLRLEGGRLYLSGICLHYIVTDTKREYGRALISVFDPGAWKALYHLGFGGKEYASGFNSIVMIGTRAYCGGWTKKSLSDGDFQAWFAEIDLDALTSEGLTELPAPLSAEPPSREMPYGSPAADWDDDRDER